MLGQVVVAADAAGYQRRTSSQVGYCAALRDRPTRSLEHRMTARALRGTAQRIQFLTAEASQLEEEIGRLVAAVAPWLLELPGMGPLSAAQVLVSWSHAGRLRSEAAFAALAGVAPIPASSGQLVRHRLNHGGDRQLNRALHTVALVRLRDDPTTRTYAARRRGPAHHDHPVEVMRGRHPCHRASGRPWRPGRPPPRQPADARFRRPAARRGPVQRFAR